MLLLITADGFGKRSPLTGFRTQPRNGVGQKMGVQDVVGGCLVDDSDEVFLVTNLGRMIRLAVTSVPVGARGARLMKLREGESVVDFSRVVA